VSSSSLRAISQDRCCDRDLRVLAGGHLPGPVRESPADSRVDPFAALKHDLGEERFAIAYAEGATLSLDDAVQLAVHALH
jgi:hypothetical protein